MVSGHRVHINSVGGLRAEGARFRGWSLDIGYILTQWVVSRGARFRGRSLNRGCPFQRVVSGGRRCVRQCNLNNAGL